jgi:transposase
MKRKFHARTSEESPHREVSTIAIEVAKNGLAVCGANAASELVLRKELRRGHFLDFMRKLPTCVVEREACGGAHYWARQRAALGHRIGLISPALVRPYR